MEKKIKYTDMAIYVDNHIYEPNKDEEKIYNYLKKLFAMIARKGAFFRHSQDYKNYSDYAATKLYLRMVNPRQFLPEDDPKKLPLVKSCLNYIKSIAYPMKVNYQKGAFCKTFDDEYEGEGITEDIRYALTQDVRNSTKGFKDTDTDDYLKSIPKIIEQCIKETPYANDKVLSHNLYLSCLISLLNNLTLLKSDQEKLVIKLTKPNNTLDKYVEDLYNKESQSAVVSFHLPEEMKGYVHVLLVKIKKLVIRDLQDISSYYEPGDELLENILMSPLADLEE